MKSMSMGGMDVKGAPKTGNKQHFEIKVSTANLFVCAALKYQLKQ